VSQRNPNMSRTGDGGHGVHHAAADFTVAALERFGEAIQFVQRDPGVGVAVVHCHLLRNRLGFPEYFPPSGT